MRTLMFVVLVWGGLAASAQATQFINVDFSTGQLWHLYGDGQRDMYPVVLPRLGVQNSLNLTQPVVGRFRHADYKPTWWPTVNMRRRNPSLPSSVSYGQPGHPIGIYRIRIDWVNPANPLFWRPVRIHGGAKSVDLHEAKSAGCVRMLDTDIAQLVSTIKLAGQGEKAEVQVSFGFFPK